MFQMIFHRISEELFPVLPEKAEKQEALFAPGRLLSFFITLIQLCGIFSIVRLLEIEKASGIGSLAIPVIAAFAVNSFLPLRFRPFLLFLTAVFVIFYAFGLFSGSFFIAAGLFMILCCHIPAAFSVRLTLVLLVAAGMLALRTDLFYAPRGALVVPFIASMFMFRLIIYLYEVRHGIPTGSWI